MLIEHNPCPACVGRREHTDEERKRYHYLAGHGYSPETGWTHPDAKAAHDRDEEAIRNRPAKPSSK